MGSLAAHRGDWPEASGLFHPFSHSAPSSSLTPSCSLMLTHFMSHSYPSWSVPPFLCVSLCNRPLPPSRVPGFFFLCFNPAVSHTSFSSHPCCFSLFIFLLLPSPCQRTVMWGALLFTKHSAFHIYLGILAASKMRVSTYFVLRHSENHSKTLWFETFKVSYHCY